ncbi:MAG TPA: ABC transporter transmembrane domain-containing protein [Ktedonobacteraceae bacterium]|nr:ABC transporter transmembrane domain-containing protein [Ktedonobacteraceae bacterium]
MLFRFLYRNFKGFRFLVVLAVLVTIGQVGSDLLVGLPLKFIPSKVNNPSNDPACQYPMLDPILNFFDTPQLDSSLQDPATHQPVPPPTSQCPVTNPNDLNAVAHPRTTHHSVIGVIVFSLLMLVLCSLLSAGLGYLDLFLASYIAYNLSARLRNQLFEHLQRLSLDWHGKQKKGDLVQRVTGNVADIEKFVTDGLADLLGSILILVGVTVIMWSINPEYTILSLAIAPPLFIVVIVYTRSIKAAAKKASKTAGQVADVATEDINALTVIKVFTREEREAMRFGGRVNENRAAGLRAGGLQAQLAPLVAILLALGNAIVIGVGGYVAAGFPVNVGFFQIAAESFDIGALVAFLFYLNKLYQPMRDISKLTTLMSNASSGVERIQEVLDQAPEVIETQTLYHGPQKLRGEINFDNVVFGYTPERPILKGINLHIPAGKKIALVGLSGGGKTTLVKLIPRFYEIQQGAVRIDGVDNRMYPLAVLRQNISMVLQDSVLFEGTIRENIAIGKPGASDDEIIDAAKKAQMHETIMGLPDGYNTLVREQGKNFSGGQRQRLAIARAILRDAPILVLDEPTASLDVEAEAEVLHALDKLIVGRTVLMISHRLSTLGNVDEVIVLKDGRIAEQGTFKELKRRGGIFAGLLEEQNRYNAERAGEQSILRSAFLPPDYQRAPVQPMPQPNRISPAAYAPANAQPQFMFDGRPLVQQPQISQVIPPREARILIELDGKIIGQRPLDKPILTIGRLTGNDVQIPNQRVSRLHAKIRQENGLWTIEDADSVNGIIYKGNRVERLTLSNGDRIHIAPTVVLHYEAKA